MTKEKALSKIGELVVYARAQGWDEEFTEAFELLKAESCEDCISRWAMLNTIEELKKIHFDRVVVLNKVRDRVLDLPSVMPKPAVGKWINKGSLACYCSICGCKNVKEVSVCPWCKSKMEVWE